MNNAGIYEFSPLENVTAEHFHKQFDLNVLGLVLTTQEAVKHFSPAGGSVVNISSIVSGTYAAPNGSVYSATKAAVDAVTRSLSKELGPRKIRVNAVNPGMIETEGFHAAGIAESDMRKQFEAKTRSAASASRRTSRPPWCSSRRMMRRGSPANRFISPAAIAEFHQGESPARQEAGAPFAAPAIFGGCWPEAHAALTKARRFQSRDRSVVRS